MELKRTAARFAKAKLSEDIITRDKICEFSRKGWLECAKFGLQSMVVPEEGGGGGLGPVDTVSVLEGIGLGCMDNGLLCALSAHIWGCVLPILRFGTEQQKKRYLSPLMDGALIGANAMTELEAGSDVYSLKTAAKKKKGHFLISGRKVFITNAPVADIFVVYVRTGNRKGMAGISCFLIEKGAKGFFVGKNIDKMGLRTSTMSEIVLDGCRVSDENLIGRYNSGAVVFNESISWERMGVAALQLGAIERLCNICAGYAKTREVFGRPIAGFKIVSDRIRDMELCLKKGRALVHRAAKARQCGRPAFIESAKAKLYVSESYLRCSRQALQIHGAYGYMTEYGLEREMRDAMASTIHSGTSEVLQEMIRKTRKVVR
ncbi:MAG: acyl-CoA dehydrogenase family protein [Candidatus Omnitrophica bacterium]|nr:acyl-CoA dehydrogenase family protein [Candidatus Omnitrophota bacterium]